MCGAIISTGSLCSRVSIGPGLVYVLNRPRSPRIVLKFETVCPAPYMPPSSGQDGSSDGVLGGNKGENMEEDLIWHRAEDINTVHCFGSWFDFVGRIGAVAHDSTRGSASTVSVSGLIRHL
ncbi:unnamed protein product [Microthlaspi erraticum]|uniref:Uncharacterized protein n=1 Tax=Microthlaspi erraticum TaxID=1685480 RepID=A0A6D2HLN4_9BRAS|nr:unnamed protein product [Microthlaspi erraticum]